MKKLLLTSIISAASFVSFAQAPSWTWAHNNGGSNNDGIVGSWTDASGNTYATGSYWSSSITFGSNTFNVTGAQDYFIVKYDPNGNVVWAHTASGGNNDIGYAVVGDASGNIYVYGCSNSSTVTFGSTVLSMAGYDDVFLVKYDASGNQLWASRAGGGANDVPGSLSLDAGGNIYITGYYVSSSITFGSNVLTHVGGNDFFIAKYNSSGTALWGARAGGSGNDAGAGIVTDASGNSYVTGSFTSSTITFGSTTLTNGGGNDYFLVKYDASGNAVWAQTATGSNNDNGYAVAKDPSGNIFVVGTSNTLSLTFGTNTLSLNGYDDIFLVKYDQSGNVLWARSAGGAQNDIGQSVCADANGDAYITGYFASPSFNFGTTTLTNNGGDDIYVAQYDANGNVVWAESAGGAGNDHGAGIGCDGSSNIYVGGRFNSSSLTMSSTTLTDAGLDDPFVGKLLGNAEGIAPHFDNGASLSLYPVPSNDQLNIRLPEYKGQTEATILIADAAGKTVYSSTVSSSETAQHVNISQFSNGVYFVTVKEGDRISSGKFIIAK